MSRGPLIAISAALSCLAALLAPGQADAASTVTKLPPRVTHVLFAGASITYGYYASSVTTTYRADLVRTLSATGRQVTASMVAQPDAHVAAALRWTYPKAATVTVVQFITDDFAAPTPLATFQSEYASLLATLRRASPGTRLLCLSDWMPPWSVNRLHLYSAQYNEAAAGDCARAGGDFVDISRFFDLADTRGPAGRATPFGRSDSFHPNDTGHRLIAQAIEEALLAPPTGAVTSTHAFLTIAPHHAPTRAVTRPARLAGRRMEFDAAAPALLRVVGQHGPAGVTVLALTSALAALAVLVIAVRRRASGGSPAAGS